MQSSESSESSRACRHTFLGFDVVRFLLVVDDDVVASNERMDDGRPVSIDLQLPVSFNVLFAVPRLL